MIVQLKMEISDNEESLLLGDTLSYGLTVNCSNQLLSGLSKSRICSVFAEHTGKSLGDAVSKLTRESSESTEDYGGFSG